MMKDRLIAFLMAIFRDPNIRIHFRALPAKNSQGSLSVPAWKSDATITELQERPSFIEELTKRNRKQGIYFVVNGGGNTDAEINRHNAVFIESDSAPIREQLDALRAAPLRPSIMVTTKRSVHAYWLPNYPLDMFQWTDIQNRLIAFFKSDPSIKNRSRLMRLPLFDHVAVVEGKYCYTPVTVDLDNSKKRYSAAELLKAFPFVVSQVADLPRKRTEARQRINKGDRNNSLASLAGSMHKRRMSSAAIEAALLSENSAKCEPPLPDEEVRSIARSISKYSQDPKEPPRGASQSVLRPLQVKRLDTVKPERFEWLWDPYIPFGQFVLIDGEEGIGKSTLMLSIGTAVAVGRGIRTVDGFEFVDIVGGTVMLLSAEDSLSHVMKPRLMALAAPLEKFIAIDEMFTFDKEGLHRLKLSIAEHTPRLVIIDPLFSYTGRINLNNDNEVRSITSELASIATIFGCTIAGVRHIGKSKGMGIARSAGLNGIGWLASARSAMLVGRSPLTGETAIAQFKTNISRRDDRAWRFEIIPETIRLETGEEIATSKLAWRGLSNLKIADMLVTSVDSQKVAEDNDSTMFLRQALSEGRRPVRETTREANQLGITEKQLRTARLKLGINAANGTITKEGFGKDATTYWALPVNLAQTTVEGQVCLNEVSKPTNNNDLTKLARSENHGHGWGEADGEVPI